MTTRLAARNNLLRIVAAVVQALKRRDRKEPGWKEKEQAEERMAAIFQPIFDRQARLIRARLQELDKARPKEPKNHLMHWSRYWSKDEHLEVVLKLLPAGLFEGLDLTDAEEKQIRNELFNTVYNGASLFQNETGYILDVGLINNEARDWAAAYSGELITKIGETTREIVREAVSDFVATPGMTIFDTMQRMPFDPQRSQTIAVTEITRSYAQGNQIAGEVMKEQFPDVPVVKVWFTNNDDLVCEICGPLNGEEVGIDDSWDSDDGPVDNPPAHVNCRCWTQTTTNILAGENPAEQAPEQAPEQQAPVPAAEINPGFPNSIDGLEKVRDLGGSTGAKLMRDPVTGKQYVMKTGTRGDHLLREFQTNNIYRDMGIRVPNEAWYETATGPVKLAEYIDGDLMLDLVSSGKWTPEMMAQLNEGFPLDVLMGNRDVIGLDWDNIIVDKNGYLWRIDNGSAFEYRAQGAIKEYTNYPTEFWTMRDKAINVSGGEFFGRMSYDDVVSQMKVIEERLRSGLASGGIGELPSGLQETLMKRYEMMQRTIAEYDTLLNDGFLSSYIDGFSRATMEMDQAGIFAKFPTKLKVSGVEVADPKGTRWDNLRDKNGNSVIGDLQKYMDANGGNYQTISYWMESQSGNSWSSASQAVKYFYAEQMGIDPATVYWMNTPETAKVYLDGALRKIGTEEFARSWEIYHSFNYNFLQSVEFKNNMIDKGIIRLIRTESSGAIQAMGLKLDGKAMNVVRGMAESSSVFEVAEVGGTNITIQNVPHSHIIGNYMFDRNPGYYHGAFWADRENEFVFLPYGVKTSWVSAIK